MTTISDLILTSLVFRVTSSRANYVYSATGESVVVVVWPSVSISKWPGPDPSVSISK